MVNSTEGVKAATILRQLAELGPKDTTTMGQAQAIAVLQAGDAAQTYLVAAAAPQLENEANSNVVGKMGYTSLPMTPQGTAGSATGLWSFGIPTGLPPERAKAALDFINWVTSKEAMTYFAEKGGIPTRSDAYEPQGVSPAAQQYFAAIKDTAGKKPVGQTRYPFATDMLTITEPILGNIAAGKVSPEDGMQQMQQELTAMAKKKGLAMG